MQEWGPLAALAGEWEGNDGLDLSFHNADGRVADTGYLEKVQLKPFGPVDNGRQCLYGLDYRMAAWRHGEEDQNPFHTEVGYWLWDAADRQVMRCFMIPRATVLIAGATCEADARRFTLQADPGQPCYGILENLYLGATRAPGITSARSPSRMTDRGATRRTPSSDSPHSAARSCTTPTATPCTRSPAASGAPRPRCEWRSGRRAAAGPGRTMRPPWPRGLRPAGRAWDQAVVGVGCQPCDSDSTSPNNGCRGTSS